MICYTREKTHMCCHWLLLTNCALSSACPFFLDVIPAIYVKSTSLIPVIIFVFKQAPDPRDLLYYTIDMIPVITQNPIDSRDGQLSLIGFVYVFSCSRFLSDLIPVELCLCSGTLRKLMCRFSFVCGQTNLTGNKSCRIGLAFVQETKRLFTNQHAHILSLVQCYFSA